MVWNVTALSGTATAALVIFGASSVAFAQDSAGWTRSVQPASVQETGGSSSALAEGDTIWQNGRLRTERFGSVNVALNDGSALTVGPNSDVVVDRFVYDPDAGSGDALIQLGVGALRMVSGNMPSDRVKIGTPVATVGIRGTDFTLEAVGTDLLKIFVDDGVVTAVTTEGGLEYEFTAPAYAQCNSQSCTRLPGGIRPRLSPPAPSDFSPFDASEVNGQDEPPDNGD